MKLTWLGHSCFLVEQDGYWILLDPYTGVEGYPPLLKTAARAADWEQRTRWKAKGGYTVTLQTRMTVTRKDGAGREPRLPVHKILCSHDHHDHNAVDQAEVVPFEGACPFTIRTLETFHDDRGGTLRGTNTIHILSGNCFTVAHLGDLGHRLTLEQQMAIGPVDAVLVPVGGHYTISAWEAKAVCDTLNPKCVIPMHYRHAPYGLPNVAGVEDFLALWPESEIRRLEGPSLELDETARGVIVPKFCEEG